jgi:hypothetical protein
MVSDVLPSDRPPQLSLSPPPLPASSPTGPLSCLHTYPSSQVRTKDKWKPAMPWITNAMVSKIRYMQVSDADVIAQRRAARHRSPATPKESADLARQISNAKVLLGAKRANSATKVKDAACKRSKRELSSSDTESDSEALKSCKQSLSFKEITARVEKWQEKQVASEKWQQPPPPPVIDVAHVVPPSGAAPVARPLSPPPGYSPDSDIDLSDMDLAPDDASLARFDDSAGEENSAGDAEDISECTDRAIRNQIQFLVRWEESWIYKSELKMHKKEIKLVTRSKRTLAGKEQTLVRWKDTWETSATVRRSTLELYTGTLVRKL